MTGIILAGGKSRRVGKGKALLKIGDKRIIEMVVEKLEATFDDTLIVTGSPFNYQFLGVKVIRDIVPEKGPLGGIYTGLLSSKSEYNFICACDMPFLNTRLLKFMASEVTNCDLVVPVVGGFVEPLHSIYSKRCLSAIKSHLEVDDLKVKNFFSEVKCRYLSEDLIRRYDPDLLSFLNLNTPKMLKLAREMWMKF